MQRGSKNYRASIRAMNEAAKGRVADPPTMAHFMRESLTEVDAEVRARLAADPPRLTYMAAYLLERASRLAARVDAGKTTVAIATRVFKADLRACQEFHRRRNVCQYAYKSLRRIAGDMATAA